MDPARPTTLDRRTFLAAAGATVLAGGRGALATSGPSRRVIVMGAGLAGLTTALDLRDAGWDVVVLEARPRVGGRVHTLYGRFSGRLHAEAGGESIDNNHYAMQALINRYRLHFEVRAPQKLVDAAVYAKGQRLPVGAFLAKRGGKVLSDYLAFDDALGAVSAGVDPEHPERAANAAALDRMSLEQFVRAQRLVPEAEFLVRLQNKSEYNAELADVSMLFVAQQTAVVADVFEPLISAETTRVAGGNSRLVEAMAHDLGRRVRLNSEVTQVARARNSVKVTTASGATFEGGQLVIAVPFMPLRRVRFTPSLPSALAAAIGGLDLGAAGKVTSEYALPFWTAEALSGFTLTDLPFTVAWPPTDSYVAARGLMTQFLTGNAARRAAAMSDRARTAAFQHQLDAVYPEGRRLRTGHAATTAWVNERFTGGGYAVFRPGQMRTFWPAIRAGVDRIHFAGEHTESLAGYMESAVRSGHRVAATLGHPPR
jgi:monoamine oxidase